MSQFTTCNSLLLKLAFSLSLLLVNNPVLAEAGKVVFSYGNVTAESPDGVVRVLSKRDHVETGDIIRTSGQSLVQMRMIDKAFIALRSNSEIKIEAYKLGATKEEDTGIFALIRGGFRSVTGIIGKRLRSAYKMRTVTATIGIRGTDYTARLCNQDCDQAFGNIVSSNSIADGLYVGVNEGGINLTNDLGTLDLDELQFGYVKDATTAPVALISAPEFLYFNSRAPNPDAEQADNVETETAESTIASRAAVEPVSSDINTDDNIKQDLEVDKIEVSQEQIEQNTIVEQTAETQSGSEFSLTDGTISSSRMIVTSYGEQAATGSISTVKSNPYTTAEVIDNELIEFENDVIGGGVSVYTAGNTSTFDLGYDPDTGIAWGRWGAGSAQLQATDGSTTVKDLTNSSLHWVTSPDQSQSIALPSSGSSSYQWVGNTSPTDNLGNAGILGNASLDANFTNMTVDTSVDIGINNQLWNGSATGLPISSNGGFSGNFSTVDINTSNGNFNGSGNAAGFFTNNGLGAGMGFSMEADIVGTDTTVTGTAIFQKQ